jgi:hypothetical protein
MRALRLTAWLLLFGAGAAPAGAQTIAEIRLEPALAKPGEPVKITVSFDNADTPNCNLRLHFGDKNKRDFKINQHKDVPLVASHTYTAAGDYTVKAEGKTALPLLKCLGANQTALVTVAEPTKTASCPAGWTLGARSLEHQKTGAYVCMAKAGTAAPALKPDCPAPLGYFEHKRKGQFGCRA